MMMPGSDMTPRHPIPGLHCPEGRGEAPPATAGPSPALASADPPSARESGRAIRVYGVDPGLANMGVVLLDGDEIVAAATLKTASEGHRPTFVSVVNRAATQARALRVLAADLGPADAVAVESYRDIPGELRRARHRWTTPLVIGRCIEQLELMGPVHYQDPEFVMRLFAERMGAWKAGIEDIKGSDLLTNEHVRSAAAHALFARARILRGVA